MSDAPQKERAPPGMITCLVTPKLTFSVPRDARWRTAADVPQQALQRGFAHRFPLPPVNLDSPPMSYAPGPGVWFGFFFFRRCGTTNFLLFLRGFEPEAGLEDGRSGILGALLSVEAAPS